MGSLVLLPPRNLAVFEANISFNITRKELKLSVIIYFHTLLNIQV